VLRSVSLILLVACAGFGVMVYLLQSSLIYLPARELVATPRDRGLVYRDVALVAADGVKLHGWFVPAEGARAVILYCHGNGGNISHRLDMLSLFHRLGFGTLIFDYRGYGHSQGKPSEQGTYRDASAAWRYLVEEQHYDPGAVVLFGRSLGGAVAAELAQHQRAGALILEGAFTSIKDMARELYPFLPIQLLMRFSYNTRTYVARARSPVLVVHSEDDEIVPFRHGQALYEAAPDPKEFLAIRGSHNEGFMMTGQRYEQGLMSFLSRYVVR
jgi:uncharacterized protein